MKKILGDTCNNWIKEKLLENDLDCKKVYKLYVDFSRENAIQWSLESYQGTVRRLKSLIIREYKLSSEKETVANVPEEELLKIIEDKVRELKRELSYDDFKSLAIEKNYSVNTFLRIPDLNRKIKFIYNLNCHSIDKSFHERKLKHHIKILKNENKELLERLYNVNLLFSEFDKVVKIYDRYDTPILNPNDGSKKREAVILLSDLHFDEIVKAEEIHGINEYSPEIAKKRLDKLFNRVLDFCSELKIDTLHIKMLGDMVSGIIHQELISNTELTITKAVFQLADYISQWIVELSKFVKVKVLGISGNHGRVFKEPYFKGKQTLNFDYMLYTFIKKQVEKVAEEFNIPESFFSISSILGLSILSLHGDICKGGTGLSPVSGTLGRDFAKMNALFRGHDLEFQYVDIAHFHTSDTVIKAFDGTIIMMNGSLVGANEYSIAKLKAGDRPSQLFYVIEEDNGMLFKSTIYVD